MAQGVPRFLASNDTYSFLIRELVVEVRKGYRRCGKSVERPHAPVDRLWVLWWLFDDLPLNVDL